MCYTLASFCTSFMKGMLTMKCTVKMIWDDESGSWYCKCVEVPEFTLGSNSFDGLVERVKIGLPDYLEVDLDYRGDVQLIFESERIENLKAMAS